MNKEKTKQRIQARIDLVNEMFGLEGDLKISLEEISTQFIVHFPPSFGETLSRNGYALEFKDGVGLETLFEGMVYGMAMGRGIFDDRKALKSLRILSALKKMHHLVEDEILYPGPEE